MFPLKPKSEAEPGTGELCPGDELALEGTTPTRRAHPLRGYLAAVLVMAASSVVCWPIVALGLDEVNVVMVFLLGIVFVAARYGRGPSIAASIASVLLVDFFFVPPYLGFVTSDVQYLIMFAVMLMIALLTSSLTSQVREQAHAARWREERTAALYRLSRSLSRLAGTQHVALAAAREVAATFGGDVGVFLSEKGAELKRVGGSSGDLPLTEHDRSAMAWAFEREKPAGAGTAMFPELGSAYLPLVGSEGALGVMVLRPGPDERQLAGDQRQLLEAFASQIAGALERGRLAQHAQEVRVQAETERLRSSLLSSVSHDLRTPLAVIAGASSSLLESDGSFDPATRRSLYQSIFDDANRLARLVDNLLEMTRIESGSLAVNKQQHVLEEVIGSALRCSNGQAGDRSVITRLPDDLPLVPMDDVLIEQVLLNLLDNAQKYVPADCPIEVSARLDGDEVTVEVADRGPGLAPGEARHVFEKFYRGRSSSGSRIGAGLGLAICRAIIAAHGGRIWAENRPGGGAVFGFNLPLTASPVAVGGEPQTTGFAAP